MSGESAIGVVQPAKSEEMPIIPSSLRAHDWTVVDPEWTRPHNVAHILDAPLSERKKTNRSIILSI